MNTNSIIGMRVELPAYSDRWMMGDRYGEIVAVAKRSPSFAKVKLDKSGKTVRFHMDELTPV
jgi:hypothetical protein